MMKSVAHRLARILHTKSKTSFAVFKRVDKAHIKVGLVGAVLFAAAYAVETKAIISLESSQHLFEVMP